MPSDVRQKLGKENLDRVQKCSFLEPQNLGPLDPPVPLKQTLPWADTPPPPPPATDTETMGIHPTGMHPCYPKILGGGGDLSMIHCHSMNVGFINGSKGRQGRPPSHKFFSFHAVFGKNFAK